MKACLKRGSYKKIPVMSLFVGLFFMLSYAVDQSPEYGRLFQKILELEKLSKYGQALKIIPSIYELEIPVQSFYDTLDEKKRELIEAAENTGSTIDGEDFSLQSMGQIFGGRLQQVDYLYYDLRISNELPPERYYYSMLFLKKGNIKDGLEALDPWILSGALFMARKSGSTEYAQSVIQRWEKRPDLWDDVCTDMALLYLATLRPDKLNRLEIKDSYIQTSLEKLQPVSYKKCPVHLMYFHSIPEPSLDFSPHRVDLYRYSRGKKLNIKRFEGDQINQYDMKVKEKSLLHTQDFSDGIILLVPGHYSFQYISGGTSLKGMAAVIHGRTGIFECKSGFFVRLFCKLTPGV